MATPAVTAVGMTVLLETVTRPETAAAEVRCAGVSGCVWVGGGCTVFARPPRAGRGTAVRGTVRMGPGKHLPELMGRQAD